ncbi:MAG: ABC transporter ATP-binding protein [Lachnospiraceae bacterium]|nr:ABC transporter ATP-binding protein [Lachnospiraceae bacterium]
MISFDNVSFTYHSLQGETRAVSQLSFRVEPQSFVAIVGPSGCGKSTILSLIAGILTPEQGEIRYTSDKKPVIGYMLQKDHLFYWRSIWQNCLLGPEIQKTVNEDTGKRLEQLLKEYGLWAFRDKKPQELSGGMRQRAALIRTLIMNPDLLLLDEPFSALDFQTRLRVSDDIAHIIREQKKTAVLITHDLQEAISLGDRVLVLSARPATLIRDVPIYLTRKGNDLLSARNAPEFNVYFNMIWEDLRGEDGADEGA